MGRSSVQNLVQTRQPRARKRQQACPRDIDCTCQSVHSRPGPLAYGVSSSLIHVNIHSDRDRDSLEAEQSKALQRSLDHFTDYDHYERCCDGHHHNPQNPERLCSKSSHDQCDRLKSCTDCFEDCDECADEHKDCYDEVEVCDDDCEQCEVECEERGHEPEDCPRDHPTTRDNCIPGCKLENTSLPQLGPTNDFDTYAMLNAMQDITPCTSDCSISMQAPVEVIPNLLLASDFNHDIDHWQTFVQAHHCAPDPCMIGQSPQSQHPQHMDPSFGFTFGCDPTIPANQYPWQHQNSTCNVPSNYPSDIYNAVSSQPHTSPIQKVSSLSTTSSQSSEANTPTVNPNPQSKTCEWVMPCGSICGATYPRTEDLKKHIKNSHSTKGTLTCCWKSCTASFATEAALTGHISKKHLTVSDEEGPWKCTWPDCTKSFMYKQVRDDHVASHNGGNRMHCPICHQWLNCEGSNFKRHMASHGPKNEYMRCQYEHLGCKKRFPRLDNLRRHEACCKFGKRAAGVHHHHHRVHIGHQAGGP